MSVDYKEQMDIINQTINDTKYLKDDYKPSRGLIKVISTWFCMYIISEIIFNFINELNFRYRLFLIYDWYFAVYKLFIVVVSLLITLFTIIYVNKINITFKERDILKGWLIFPILFTVIDILPVFTSFLNSELVFDFYSAFPLTLLLTLMMVVFIYSQYKYKELIGVILLNSISIMFTFVIMSLIINSDKIISISSRFIFSFNEFLSFKGWEIIIILLTLFILKRRLKYE